MTTVGHTSSRLFVLLLVDQLVANKRSAETIRARKAYATIGRGIAQCAMLLCFFWPCVVRVLVLLGDQTH
jgi:hypothetical protein